MSTSASTGFSISFSTTGFLASTFSFPATALATGADDYILALPWVITSWSFFPFIALTTFCARAVSGLIPESLRTFSMSGTYGAAFPPRTKRA